MTEEASSSPSIHFDGRIHDLTSSVKNPILYFATEDISLFNPNDKHVPKYGSNVREDIEDVSSTMIRRSIFSFLTTRYGILFLVSLVPFGSHYVKNSLSSLQVFFMEDPELHLNATKYGLLISAYSFPNILMPFLGGLILDSKGPGFGICVFLGIAVIGCIVLTVAMSSGNYPIALSGSAIYGLGSGTLVVAQRAVVSKYFYDKELTFALGVTVAVACGAKTLAKAASAPIAVAAHSYPASLWFGTGVMCISFAAGIAYTQIQALMHQNESNEIGHIALTPSVIALAFRQSTLGYWLLITIHTLFIMIYHLFANFSGHYLIENYSLSAVEAGYVSSLMPFMVVICAPAAGFVLDKYGRQLFVLLTCSITTLITYIFLLKRSWNPVVCVLLLALCESFVPTILLSAYPLTVNSSFYGAAFGFSEVLQALALLVGNAYMGWSRDVTAAYSADIKFVACMTILCILLIFALLVWNYRHGNILNYPRSRFGYRSLTA